MTYRFKLDQEAVWFVVIAAGTVILQALSTLDVDKIVDWRVWAVGLLVASIRAAAGAALSLLSPPRLTPPDARPLTAYQTQQVADEIERRLRADADETAPHG